MRDKKPLPTILALETATDACSCTLLLEEQSFDLFEIVPRQHTHRIFPMLEALLTKAGVKLQAVDAIAVGQGPGSFTGVRFGLSLAQGLAYGLNVGLFGVSTLAALAFHQAKSHIMIPALDARMGEVYTGVYAVQNDSLELIETETVSPPMALLDLKTRYPDAELVGSGWDVYYPHEDNLKLKRYPHAKAIAEIAQKRWLLGEKGSLPQEIKPSYIRNNVAKKSISQVNNDSKIFS